MWCSALQRVFRQLFDCTRHAVCNVLQRVAVCCSVLQCVAVCIPHIFRQHTAYSTQCVAVRCSAVCCSAVCCSAPQCVFGISFDYTRHAVRCNVLHHITLQDIAVHCNMFFADFRLHTSCSLICSMGWLRLVGSLKWKVSFAKEPYKRDYILQKRPMILFNKLTNRSHPTRAHVADTWHAPTTHMHTSMWRGGRG